MQTASRAPFLFVFSGFHQRKSTCERRDSGCESDVDAQRHFGSTDRNIWHPSWGTIQNTVPPARTIQIQEMRSTRQGLVEPNGGKGLTLQQVMETMQALQDEVAASITNQERIQADLETSWATNEELRRSNEELRKNLLNHAGEREEKVQELASQGVPYAVLPRNHGCRETSHAYRAQSYLHWYGGPGGPSHGFPYADDAGWWLRCCEMQAVHEHSSGNDDGLVHQPP